VAVSSVSESDEEEGTGLGVDGGVILNGELM
jgi:hypothetical protein